MDFSTISAVHGILAVKCKEEIHKTGEQGHEKGKNRKKKWIKKRHAVITSLVRPFLWIFLRLKSGVKVHRFREQGNRPYSGKIAYIKPSIAKLVRKLNMPLAIFRIENGYGVQPRWSDHVRKGKMCTKVTRVLEPEEIKNLSDEALFGIIRSELEVNEACTGGPFTGKNLAQYLERAIYVCPICGLAAHESYGDVIECTKCHNKVQYLLSRELKGVDGEFPFRFVADWYEYQCDVVNRMNPTEYVYAPLFEDVAALSEVILYKKKCLLRGNSKLSTLNFMALCCVLGLVTKKLINPFVNVVTEALHIPGGISTGFSIMFLVIATELVQQKYCATLMATVQGLVALALGRVGSMGILAPIGYIVPGVAIDLIYAFNRRIKCTRTERMMPIVRS